MHDRVVNKGACDACSCSTNLSFEPTSIGYTTLICNYMQALPSPIRIMMRHKSAWLDDDCILCCSGERISILQKV